MSTAGDMMRGMAVGAGLMYLLDPHQGRRRRALVRDQFVHARNTLDDAVDTAARDLRHRAGGLVAETRARFRREEVDDPVLEARVRSKIGRACSHPHAIAVGTQSGVITLSGPVLEEEAKSVIEAAESVRGVKEVIDDLEPHDEPGTISALQGQGRRGRRSGVLQENWTPSTRVLIGMSGGLMAMYGARAGGPVGALMSATGLGVVARAATNMEVRRITGVNAGRRAIDIRKAINVDAPIEEVWAFWSRFENFPRFMSHVRDVTQTGEGTSHWEADGPAGMTVAWEAYTTEWVPNEVIAWKSVPGSEIGNAGIVRFDRNPEGGTRVDIRLTYNPPAGAIGHALASLLGRDPKQMMDEDLVRFKTLIEEGKTRTHGHVVTRTELEGDGEAPTGELPH